MKIPSTEGEWGCIIEDGGPGARATAISKMIL